VFPAALRSSTPVVAFTATRWATLLEPPTEWPAAPASAADCYRYCLAQPAVTLVLTAPKTTRELDQNLEVLASPRMNARDQRGWERYGDLIHGRGIDAFESQWP
jgi:hypothetical protein